MGNKNQSSRSKIIAPMAVVILAIVIGGIIINRSHKDVKQLSSENVKLEDIITKRDSLMNELINAFDSIEESLTFVNERRSKLVIENNETSKPSKKEAIIKDIQLMNAMLEESSVKIEELEKKLSNSGANLRSFNIKIADLNKKVKSQNIQILELHTQVEQQNEKIAMVTFQKDSLQNEVLAFQDTIYHKEEILIQKNEIINEQVLELHKGFYAYGTYKELFENGVLSKDGGFLGLFGKNKVLQDDLNEAYFTQLDIVETQTIPLNSEKVHLISEHPANSYKFVEENGFFTKLEIEIPEDFWKITSYAVIEVK